LSPRAEREYAAAAIHSDAPERTVGGAGGPVPCQLALSLSRSTVPSPIPSGIGIAASLDRRILAEVVGTFGFFAGFNGLAGAVVHRSSVDGRCQALSFGLGLTAMSFGHIFPGATTTPR
jgi:hypothetical protein